MVFPIANYPDRLGTSGKSVDNFTKLTCLEITDKYQKTPLIQKLVFRIANYPDRLDTSGKSVDNFTKPTCLEITDYQIKYSTVLWYLEP